MLMGLELLGFCSTYFLVPKENQCPQTHLGFRIFEQFCLLQTVQNGNPLHFMLTVQPGEWLASCDSWDAYFQVPFRQSRRKLLWFAFWDKPFSAASTIRAVCFSPHNHQGASLSGGESLDARHSCSFLLC